MIAVHLLRGGIADGGILYTSSTVLFMDGKKTAGTKVKIAKAILRLRHDKRRRDEYGMEQI